MDYFSKFLRTTPQALPKPIQDHADEFSKSWNVIKTILEHPDERQITKGIKSTEAPAHLQSMVDALVRESSHSEEGATGACLEFLLKNDVLGTLVRLAEPDRPSGIQAEVLRAVQNMVVLMDEQFLVHSAVHRAVLRLLRNCAGDDIQEQLDGRNRVMGAAKNAVRSQPSDYELDLLNLLCILCSRIRTYRELLMIFFHDKHWYHSEPLFSVEEEDEDEDEDEDEGKNDDGETGERASSPTPSQVTITSAHASQAAHSHKTEYEFLLFNYLLRFVHREGQIGDFARTGLLFLMDVAMSPGEQMQRLAGEEQESAPASISETAVRNPITDAALALAEYIVDGDFSDVLGAGLGAVYSLLPSKLEIKSPTRADPLHGSGMVLGSTGPETEDEIDHAELVMENNRVSGMEDSSNPDFKSRLDHFLKLLEFLQDILRRNAIRDTPESGLDASALVGTSIVHSILDAVRRSFLENILYPSILECSDLDGSAVAVMSYIDIVIRTLEPGQLSDLFVEFLMSEDNDDVSRSRPHPRMLNLSSAPPRAGDRATKLRRRKSSAMVLLEMEAPESQKQSEYFTSMGRFTLKDLLLSNLRSKNQATVASALQLLQSMLSQRCHVSTSGLFLVFYDANATSYPEPAMIFPDVMHAAGEDSDEEEEFVYPGAEETKPSARPQSPPLPTFVQPDITFSTHEREMGLYLTLVSRVDPSHNDDAFSTGYDHYLADAMSSIQNHSCFHIHDDEDMNARSKFKHRLNVNDPILSLVLESMRTFFSNSPKMNISLTGVLAELAVCPNRSIAGWLTCVVSETHASFSDPNLDVDDGRDDRSIDSLIDEKFATETNILPAIRLDEHTRPVVHTIFQGLVGQLERYRQSVENFDQYLLERRQGLLFSENLTDALTLSLEPVQDALSPNLSQSGSWDVVQAPDTPPQRPKPKPKTSALVSFLTPRKSKPAPSKAPSEPTTPPRSGDKNVAASPFAPHYQRTRDIVVEPFVAPVPQSGHWILAQPSRWNTDEDDVFSADSQWGGHAAARSGEGDSNEGKATQVTLSQLLDNVVILEECIKELVAIIHARRSLGIDLVRYV
ncbi:Retinoic acid induced 16-like protein-domain-containing protein [Suillus bovinus]|uniref:Retinoic acid induced 16-like protein-domain-containing protein n=1 Tax=Suillus bovinus TaxID=48563 RepID=UPI001B869927|nr:Retinoic acid induced 16-like protein-domain-containing protein [Suillus bovinus]KAG2132501.1 Retinoic acid induced 16-like protein-domain-containing protein [Suillus bovinus]